MSTVEVILEPSSWSGFTTDSSPTSSSSNEKNNLTNEESIYLIIFFGSILYFLYTFLKSKT